MLRLNSENEAPSAKFTMSKISLENVAAVVTMVYFGFLYDISLHNKERTAYILVVFKKLLIFTSALKDLHALCSLSSVFSDFIGKCFLKTK